MAFTADARFVALPPDMLSRMRTSEDDIPPRSGFQILDRDKPESIESLPPVDEIPEAVAMLFVFGKQTDREARIEVHDIRSENVEEVRSRINACIGDKQWKQENGEPLPLIVACQPPIAMIRFQAKPAEAESLQADLAAARMPAAIASAKLPILGGMSLRDTIGDEAKLLERTAVVRIVTQYDAIASKGDNIIAEVYRLAGLEPLPPITPNAEQIETLGNEDLNRVDASGLDAESLLYLLQRSQQISATPALRRFASQLIQLDLSDEQRPVKMLAYMTLINAADRTDAALKILEQAKEFAEANNLSIANLLLSEVSLRLSAGDGPGFQKVIETLSTRHANDPEIMAQLQQILMAYGLIGPDGTPRSQRMAAPGTVTPDAQPSGGGLWTPESAAAEPAAEAGGSKLWIPGMD